MTITISLFVIAISLCVMVPAHPNQCHGEHVEPPPKAVIEALS
jgi:hypothetical protein